MFAAKVVGIVVLGIGASRVAVDEVGFVADCEDDLGAVRDDVRVFFVGLLVVAFVVFIVWGCGFLGSFEAALRTFVEVVFAFDFAAE